MTWHNSYSPYARYTGHSIGRILHFVYHYCGLHLAEHVQLYYRGVDEPLLKYGDERIASISWDDETPLFNFFPDGWAGARGKPVYSEELRKSWHSAQVKQLDSIKYPVAYMESKARDLVAFVKQLESVIYDRPSVNAVTERLIKVINNLPIDALTDYIRVRNLYEAVKEDKETVQKDDKAG